MAKQKKGDKTQTKKAMEFIFCIMNERELFNAIKALIDEKMPSATNNY